MTRRHKPGTTAFSTRCKCSKTMAIDKAIHTAHATRTGARTGTTASRDGATKMALSTPKELGGAGGASTNPERLFAAGHSACFVGAMKAVAARQKIDLLADVSIDANVSMAPLTGKAGAFGIAVMMAVSLPGMGRAEAEKLVAMAHQVCPYSNATRGNVGVALSVV